MEEDWEAAAEKEVVIRPKPAVNVNKWEGEDDDEDVKDSWEDEEKKDEEKVETVVAPAKTKPSKALKAKLAEEERLAEEAELQRLANLTPEEKLAEKLRLQKIQEESDLKVALETFGISNIAGGGGLESFDPQSKEDFKEFGATLSWKLAQYKESPHFPQFIEDLVRSLCCNLSAADMKKVKISIENLHSEKLKLEKQSAKKNAGKSSAKATLRADINDIDGYQKYGNNFAATTFDEYDDFM